MEGVGWGGVYHTWLPIAGLEMKESTGPAEEGRNSMAMTTHWAATATQE
jgi:hypothetical protein